MSARTRPARPGEPDEPRRYAIEFRFTVAAIDPDAAMHEAMATLTQGRIMLSPGNDGDGWVDEAALKQMLRERYGPCEISMRAEATAKFESGGN